MGIGTRFNGTFEVDLSLEIIVEAKLLCQLLKLIISRLFHFRFDLISDTKLVLDVLGTTHASEDTTTDHDTHLG